MKQRISIIAILLLLTAGSVKAQYNETNNLFYFAMRTPQTNQLNPALFPNALFYMQLPGLSGLQMGFPLAIGDIAQYDPVQKVNIINVNNILDKLGQNNDFRFGLDLNLFGFGAKIAFVHFDFNTQLRSTFNFGIPVSTINTVLEGNVNNDGTAIPEQVLLDGDLLNLQMYLETSIGAGVKIPTIPLTVGFHAKLLSGIVNLQTENTRVTFETEEDFESVRANMYYEVRGASVVPIDTTGGTSVSNIAKNMFKNVGDIAKGMYSLNNGNTGVAFDLGASYKLGPVLLSASVNDLSAGIHWQKNLMRIVPTNGAGTISFDGTDIQNFINRGDINTDTLMNYINNQLKGMSPEFQLEGEDYWYTIPTKINLGAQVDFLSVLHAGILFHGQFDRGLLSRKNQYELDLGEVKKNTFRYNTTLSVGVNVFNWMELIVASSVVYDGHSKFGLENILNPGFGLVLTPATVLQAYVMADYLSSMYLTSVKALNLKFGLNIVIGRANKLLL